MIDSSNTLELCITNMLASPFNEDLRKRPEKDDEKFDAAIAALLEVNPAIAKQAELAGAFVRRMMTHSPENAGGVLLEAWKLR